MGKMVLDLMDLALETGAKRGFKLLRDTGAPACS